MNRSFGTLATKRRSACNCLLDCRLGATIADRPVGLLVGKINIPRNPFQHFRWVIQGKWRSGRDLSPAATASAGCAGFGSEPKGFFPSPRRHEKGPARGAFPWRWM